MIRNAPVLLACAASVTALMISACTSASASKDQTSEPVMPVTEGYIAERADLFQWATRAEYVPAQPEARSTYISAIAQLATLYGALPVEQYKQMYAQAIDTSDADYTGFNVFDRDEDLARPGYRHFKTPNTDTLYLNAWLDLTDGPVLITVPATDGRFYTVNFLDAYGNATNISTSTRGSDGGTYLIATTGWEGEAPPGSEIFRVTTPYQWVLGRVFTTGGDDLDIARAYQKEFTITPSRPDAADGDISHFPSPVVQTPADFFTVLDFIIDTNGLPVQETALISQFASLGIGGAASVEEALSNPAMAAGAAEGYGEGWRVILGSAGRAGTMVGTWRVPTDAGRYGFNYITRSGFIRATGANVITEYYPFGSSFDSDGEMLDGSKSAYEVTLPTEPPVEYFWSLILYDARTAELHDNPIDKYQIGDRTEGLQYNSDGSLTIRLQNERPDDVPVANWLPVPDGPFYLALRNQGAAPEIYNGEWVPGPVTKLPAPQPAP